MCTNQALLIDHLQTTNDRSAVTFNLNNTSYYNATINYPVNSRSFSKNANKKRGCSHLFFFCLWYHNSQFTCKPDKPLYWLLPTDYFDSLEVHEFVESVKNDPIERVNGRQLITFAPDCISAFFFTIYFLNNFFDKSTKLTSNYCYF